MDDIDNPKSNQSFQWWNSQIEGCYDLLNPPQLVSAKVATSIFYKIFPTLMIFDEFNDNDQAYWGEIHRFLKCRYQNIEIPSPSLNFPQFISILYSVKDEIKLNNLAECFQFILAYQTAQPAFFLLRQYPIIVNDPLLYFETIIYFSNFNKQMWQSIIKEYRFFDNFFYMNKNFFTHFPKNSKVKDWTAILFCSSAFSKVLSASLEYHTHAFTHSMLYIKEIIKFFEVVPDDVCTSLLRDIFSIIKSCYQKIALRDKLEPKIADVLHSLLSRDSSNLKYAIKFSLSFEPSIISSSLIVSILTKREILCICDIEILETVLDSSTAYDILVYLSKIMIQSKLFHRSCSAFILKILKKYDKNKNIYDYGINLVNGLFIFISHARKMHKYKYRILLICETLSMFMESNIFWLQKSVINAASTIAQVGFYPSYFDLIFPITFPKDSSIVDLMIQSISKAKKPKYKFFPFIKIKNDYLLLNSEIIKNGESIKKINECINTLKTIKTKVKLQNLVNSLSNEFRNLFVLQTKWKYLFPRDFDSVLLSIVKLKVQMNVINIYQLMKNVLLFMNDSNITRIIDALNFGIETKNFVSIYEFAIVLKKYGTKFVNLASVAIDRLIATELNSTWAIQTYRRIIKNSKLKNELVSAIVLSSISSDDEFVKIEGIKTIPYILSDDIDEISLYQNLKNDLISSNKNIAFVASKSLAQIAYNSPSIAQNIFTKLVKKQERLNAFEITFPLFLKHFNVSMVLSNLNQWSLFLLNLNDSFEIHHVSSISRIVIHSFVSILGEKCSIIISLLNNVNKEMLNSKQTVIILNAFALSVSSEKFIVSNQEIFFNALKNEIKEIRFLAIQCFEQIAKNHPSLGVKLLQKLINLNENDQICYFQAEALILKHIYKIIDEETLNLIISNNSLFNIIVLSFLLPKNLPKNIFNYEGDQNIIKKLVVEIQESKLNVDERDEKRKSTLKKYKNYLAFFLFKHYKAMPEELVMLILKLYVDQFDSLPRMALQLIYKVASNYNDAEISKVLVEQSFNIVNSSNSNFNFSDEFDRKRLFDIQLLPNVNKFSFIILENDMAQKSLIGQVISSFKSLILKIQLNDRKIIINRLFKILSTTTTNKILDQGTSILAYLSLIEHVLRYKNKSILPTNGLSILLGLQRSRTSVEKISICVSKWVSLFQSSLDECFNSFIYNDAAMFSFFLKNYSSQLNEFAAETFYVQLKLHIDSNPLIALKAIPAFMKSKHLTKEMKTSLFSTLEEFLSYDFLVRPETIRDYYEAISSFESLKFSKIILSLLNFPLNSSTATFYGIKLMKKIKNKSVFYDILDEIIDKNDILNKERIPYPMNNEILYKALKIRNTIENVPLMLLLYQQTKNKRMAKLVKKTFDLNSEVLSWATLCKMIIIDKILPTKKIQLETFSEDKQNEDNSEQIHVKPNFLVKKLMMTISKKLVSKIRDTYPFQLEYIEIIFDIAMKCFSNIKLQKKVSSILSAIINKFGNVETDGIITNRISSMQAEIATTVSNASMFIVFNKFVFNLIDFYEKDQNQQYILNWEKNLTSIVSTLEKENILMFLRLSSRLFQFSSSFKLYSNFEMRAKEFFSAVFDKKYHLRGLKKQLGCFVEIIIKYFPSIIPDRILRILVVEEIFHRSHDSLFGALAVLVNKVREDVLAKKEKSGASKTEEKASDKNAKDSNKHFSLPESNENSNDSNENNNEPNENENESTENSNESNENKNESNENESNENENESNENENESNRNNESNESNDESNEGDESNESNESTESRESNECDAASILNTESSYFNLSLSESSLSSSSLSSKSSLTRSNPAIPAPAPSSGMSVDEVMLILSKAQTSIFNRGEGYQRFITSVASIVPRTIGVKWKTVVRVILSSSFSTPETVNFECLAILFQKVHSKVVTDYGPAIFRTIILSKDTEKVVSLSSIIFDKLLPQINELLLAELVNLRSFDLPLISRILRIGFENLSGYCITNSSILNFLKKNVLDFSLSFVGNLLCCKKTEKQGVVLMVQLFESIATKCLSDSNYSNTNFNQIVIKLLCLFRLFLSKAKSLLKKKDLKKCQLDISRFILLLLQHIDLSLRSAIYDFIKIIPKDVLNQAWSKFNVNEIEFVNFLEKC